MVLFISRSHIRREIQFVLCSSSFASGRKLWSVLWCHLEVIFTLLKHQCQISSGPGQLYLMDGSCDFLARTELKTLHIRVDSEGILVCPNIVKVRLRGQGLVFVVGLVAVDRGLQDVEGDGGGQIRRRGELLFWWCEGHLKRL